MRHQQRATVSIRRTSSFVAAALFAAGVAVCACEASFGRLHSPAAEFPLAVSGTSFVDRSGSTFEWRGITAFRLAELIASGNEKDAVAFLDWAASQRLTVVRVLVMAKHLFELTPDRGRAALPRLLELARERGIAVEVVALADTRAFTFDLEAHVREVGRIAREKSNALVEIANEPGHPTQDSRLHDPAFVRLLAALLPNDVVVALGSLEWNDGFAAGDYATLHSPRGEEWKWVLELAAGARRLTALGKPLVSDEPIGAGERYQPGRRDNEPTRFAASAALTRLAGMGATFHYDGGLQTRVPTGRELACFEAWRSGWNALDGLAAGEFLAGPSLKGLAEVSGARAVYARRGADQAMLLLIEPGPDAKVRWTGNWQETGRTTALGVIAVRARSGP